MSERISDALHQLYGAVSAEFHNLVSEKHQKKIIGLIAIASAVKLVEVGASFLYATLKYGSMMYGLGKGLEWTFQAADKRTDPNVQTLHTVAITIIMTLVGIQFNLPVSVIISPAILIHKERHPDHEIYQKIDSLLGVQWFAPSQQVQDNQPESQGPGVFATIRNLFFSGSSDSNHSQDTCPSDPDNDVD